MLKRVVFILKKENVMEEIAPLLKELADYKTDAYVESIYDRNMEGEISENTLYITDSAVCQKQLQSRNFPVIIYLHEGNREEDFSRAEYAIEKIEEIEYESLELAYLRLTGLPWTILTTDRCIVRETTVEDADSFYEIYEEPSITYYMEDLYADKKEEIAYIQDYIKNIYGFYGYGMWTVLEKNSGQVIGRAGLSLREGWDIPELGFVIAVPYQRQGYAYEVCQAILAFGREELGFNRVQAFVMKENEKSRALCEKLGFEYAEKVEIEGVEYERMVWESK